MIGTIRDFFPLFLLLELLVDLVGHKLNLFGLDALLYFVDGHDVLTCLLDQVVLHRLQTVKFMKVSLQFILDHVVHD